MCTPNLRVTMALLPSLLACLFGCSEDGGDEPYLPSMPENAWRFITDDRGGALTLRGVNVMSSAKSDPLRLSDFSRSDAERVAGDFGWNFARVLIFWDAIEPRPGEYDRIYLDRLEERLDWFADLGIHVMLDMHQDVYAQRFCCDGAPEWAIEDDGQPFALQDQWFANYFQPAVQHAFDNFWDYEGDHPELQDHYAGAWQAVADRFKDHPAVIGYDLFNEPHPGSMADPAELVGVESADGGSHQTFDRTRLGPFYQRLIDRLREVDPDGWIFFEPRYGAPGNGLPNHLPFLSDPREGEPRLGYAPHLYSFSVEARRDYDPDTDRAIPRWEQRRSEEMSAQRSPLLMGEWGIIWNYGGATTYLREIADMADRLMAGWAYWSYDPGGFSFLDEHGDERESVSVLVRPYPRRVAGAPQSFDYDPATRRFTLEYLDRPGVEGPTEIYIPAARFYPEGWTLDVPSDGEDFSMEWDAEREIAWLTIPPADRPHRVVVQPR